MKDESWILYLFGGIWVVAGFYMMGRGGGVTGLAMLASGIALLAWIAYQKSKDGTSGTATSSRAPSSTTRSDWEKKVASIVREEAGSYSVVENDRSVIPGKNGGANLEIDVYIPSLKVGFEANGEHWHDHAGYRRDCLNGTEYTEERYKERWCRDHGIKLVHLWDSQTEASIRSDVKAAIREKRGW